MKKRLIAVMMALVGLMAGAIDFSEGAMRVEPVGYRVGSEGEISSFSASVVSVTPSGVGIAVPTKALKLTAALDRDWKIVSWQKFDANPTVRKDLEPLETFGAGETSVSVDYDPDVTWMYVTVVVRYDPVRTLKAGLSSFSRGKVTVSPEKQTYLKGDAVTLTAQPDEGYAFVRWSDGNTNHVRRLELKDDLDLTAYIEPISSRVTFDPGASAVVGMTEKRVSYDSVYGELPVPTRTGSTFNGWLNDEDHAVTEKTTVYRTLDHVLHAFWSVGYYDITWEIAGAANGRVDGGGAYAYGSKATLSAVPYEGAVFAGWTDGEVRNPRRVDVFSNAQYVAAFDVAKFEVRFTYRDADGKLVTTTQSNVVYGTAAKAPTVPQWAEHTFRAWSTEEYKKVSRDLSVEALYDAETYAVTFAYRDWQGNAVTTMPQNVISGGRATPPEASVANIWEGHTLRGWTPDYNVIRADTLCEAIYDLNVYTVTFSYCDAKGEELKHVEMVPHGEKVPFDFAEGVKNLWKDHPFIHWTTGGVVITNITDVIASGNTQISAVYEGYTRIEYLPGDGQGKMPPQVYTNFSGEVTLCANAFTRTGYLFTGWTEGGKHYADGAKVLMTEGQTLTLTAEWTPITYTVTLHKNDGVNPETTYDRPDSCTYDQPDQMLISRTDFGSKIGWRDGYTFIGWCTTNVWSRDEADLVAKEDSILLCNLATEQDARVDLYAVWESTMKFTVTINGVETNLAFGAKLPEPPKPTKTGYTSTGWQTNNTVDVTFPITVTGSFELNPKWTANTYTVAFNANEGSGSMSPEAFRYDQPQALTSNSFTRTGYEFAGWATTSTGGAAYQDGQTVSNLTVEAGATYTLFAKWNEGTVTSNEYAMALGLPPEWDVKNGSWSVASDGNGLTRDSSGSESLKIPIPGPGKLFVKFQADEGNSLTIKCGEVIMKEWTGEEEGQLEIEGAGDLEFVGAPGSDETWKLFGFKWTVN